MLHWFLGGVPVRAVGQGGRKIPTRRKTMAHLSLSQGWPGRMPVNHEANQVTPRPFRRVGEEFSELDPARSSGVLNSDDETLAESGEGGLEPFGLGRVVRVQHAPDYGFTNAQAPGEFVVGNPHLFHRQVQSQLAGDPKRRWYQALPAFGR